MSRENQAARLNRERHQTEPDHFILFRLKNTQQLPKYLGASSGLLGVLQLMIDD